MKIDAHTIWSDLQQIRESVPLIHNITNYVVMNNTANALLALGASPVMAHALEEVEDMVRISGALVITIGTLSGAWIQSMQKAMLAAQKLNKPIFFDPVGVGATSYRTATAQTLVATVPPTVIRGNASEVCTILAINQESAIAAAHAMALMGITGELAAKKASGPGSFQLHFLDALYNLTKSDVEERLKLSEV